MSMPTLLAPPAGLRLIQAVRADADEHGPREWIVDGDSPVLAVAVDPAAPENILYITPNNSGTLADDFKGGEVQALQEADGRVITPTGAYTDVDAWLASLNRRDMRMAEVAGIEA